MGRSKTQLRNVMSTSSLSEFRTMIQSFRGRVNVIAEGDSWFAYPRSYMSAFGGAPNNIMAHVQRRTRRAANLLRLDVVGDEAVTMLSGAQRVRLGGLLRKYHDEGRPIDLLLFSGGGNDVAGDLTLDRLLKKDAGGATSGEECFAKGKLANRMKQIELAYRDLIDLRDTVSPNTEIVTHSYDYPYPDGRKARFFKLAVAGPWLEPYLAQAGVPVALRRPACNYLIDRFFATLSKLPTNRFTVVDTRGVLRSKSDWLNELHPTAGGFEKIARRFYTAMRRVRPALPAWS
jgi:hypothetical protein